MKTENIRLVTFILSIFFLTNFNLVGQTQIEGLVFNNSNSLATSPEAALLGRFGDIPINSYNGTASISIPLWTIDENDFKLPINLLYNTSGVKVEDEATWVGLGWMLEPGGSIIQVVNGIVDELDDVASMTPSGYQTILSWPPQTPSITGRSEDNPAVWPGYAIPSGTDDPVTIGALSEGKGQPDIYIFNFGDYSGKFYVNPIDKTIVILNKSDEITFIQNNDKSWTAITLDGTKYSFSDIETSSTITPYPDYRYVGNTWKLSKIELNNQKSLYFRYVDGGSHTWKYTENYRDIEQTQTPSLSSGSINSTLTEVFNKTKYLYEIEGEFVKIIFNLEFNREDIEPLVIQNEPIRKTPRLQSVDIYDKINAKRIKSYSFTYSYYSNTQIGGNFKVNAFGGSGSTTYINKRLKLDEIKEIGYTTYPTPVADLSKPPYRFFYNEITLPLKTSQAQDYWGFYNGIDNNRLTPDFSFHYYSGAYPSYSSLPAYLFNGSIGFAPFSNNAQLADRSVDTALVKAGMLNKIIYPTKGYSVIEYESNEFSNFNYPIHSQIEESKSNILLIDQNESYNTISHDFSLNRTSIVRFRNTLSKGTPWNEVSFQQMLEAKITLLKLDWGNNSGPPIVSAIRTWQMLNHIDYQSQFETYGFYVFEEDVQIEYQPNTTYYVSVSLPDELGPQDDPNHQASVISRFTYYNLPQDDLIGSYGGGLRVKAIINYDNNDVITNGKKYKYTQLTSNNTSGKLMSPLKFIYFRNHFRADYTCQDCSTMGGDDNKFYILNNSNILVYFYSSENSIPFSSSSNGNLVGYSRVEISSLGNNGDSNGITVQNYHNEQNITYPGAPDVSNLMNGKLIKEEILNNAGDHVIDKSYEYRNLSTQPLFFGIRCYNATDVDPGAISSCCNSGCCNVPFLMHSWPSHVGSNIAKRYLLLFYAIENKWIKLEREIITTHTETEDLIETIAYSYNSLGQITESVTTNSKNQVIKNQSIYPVDENSQQADLLKLNGRYDLLLRKLALTSENQIETFDYFYKLNESNVVYDRIQTKVYNDLPQELISYDKWSNDKLLQFTKKDKASSVIWGYNTSQIIAVTENAAQKSNSFSSFENAELGGWILNQQSIISWDPFNTHTGEYYLYGGCQRSFPVGDEALKHEGYTASVWVKGSSQAFIRIEQTGNPSSTVEVSNTGAPGEWNLIEVKIPKAKYIINGSLILKVTIGGDANALWDDIRFHPSDASMTTYTYAPLIGMTSQSDANNLPTYYEYDPFGRLKLIRDHKKNILKTFEYNYAH